MGGVCGDNPPLQSLLARGSLLHDRCWQGARLASRRPVSSYRNCGDNAGGAVEVNLVAHPESGPVSNKPETIHSPDFPRAGLDADDAAARQVRVDKEASKSAQGASADVGPVPFSPDEVMARVRAEMVRREVPPAHVASSAAAISAVRLNMARDDHLPRWQPAAERLGHKSEYVLSDYLRFDDEDFVDVAYQKLLLRPADAQGRQDYLDALRSGATSKVEILGSIRFSEEGRRCAVHVDGLLLPYKLHRWRHRRFVGWFVGMGMALVRLPRLAWRLQGMEAAAARESHEAGRLLNRTDVAVERHFADVDGAINALRNELAQSVAARAEGLRALEARTGALESAVDSTRDMLYAGSAERASQHQALQERLAAHQAALRQWQAAKEDAALRTEEALRAQEAQQEARLKALGDRQSTQDAALARLREQVGNDQRSLRAMLERLTVFLDVAVRHQANETGRDVEGELPVDTQYASFEQAFRGEREQIKQRVAYYLDTLAMAGIEPGDEGVILDLGSGRGEWLEVLQERGYRGRGVDLDRGMLKESEARGHDVVEADALDYLRAQDSSSIAVISSLHMVEHIPHSVLLHLLDEALRVLRPGGVLILETPNPENVLVGSCTFYFDPTHRNPLPPQLLQWVVQSRGFDDAVIDRLSEHRGKPALRPVSNNVPAAAQINQMIEWFTAPPDYAVVARKPTG